MSTSISAKKASSAGMLVAVFILTGTLLLNVYLFRRPVVAERAGPAASATKPGSPAVTARSGKTLTTTAIAAESDLETLRDTLVAAGASDTRVREIIWGVLRWQFRDEQTKKRLARLERGWWKDEQRTMGISRSRPSMPDDAGLMRKSVDDKFEALMGMDPAEERVRNARYSFLPEDLRMKLGRLDHEMGREYQRTGDPEADAAAEAELAKNARENRAEKERLLTGLTPEQRLEYDMHYGSLGTSLANSMGSVPGSTEEEFRKLYRIASEFGTSAGLSTTQIIGPGGAVIGAVAFRDDAAGTPPPQQPITERMVAELGYDRALEYVWMQTPEYRAVSLVAKETNLDPTAAARFTQLAAETGLKALGIHQDASLTVEQRRAALVALQQTARAQVDAVVPPDAQQNLPANALQWLTQMSDGRYKVMTPGVPGRGGSSYARSITAANTALPGGVGTPLPVRPTSP
jgi:hypothetical protein